jgi:hypothetical protein
LARAAEILLGEGLQVAELLPHHHQVAGGQERREEAEDAAQRANDQLDDDADSSLPTRLWHRAGQGHVAEEGSPNDYVVEGGKWNAGESVERLFSATRLRPRGILAAAHVLPRCFRSR